MKILVLEQNRYIMELLIDILSLQGYEVSEADKVEDAISTFKLNAHEVIILDTEFQNSASEVIRRIRELSKSVQFVVLTTFNNEELIRSVNEYNIAEFIPRDTSTELLLKIVSKSIKKIGELPKENLEEIQTKSKILVVDDSALIRKILQDFLKERGYTVILACDGKEALDIIQKEIPHLMLLDITMPVMDGIEVMEKLKELNIKFPIIVITNNTDIKIAKKTLDIGAYDYIAKPINFEYLETSILAKILHKV